MNRKLIFSFLLIHLLNTSLACSSDFSGTPFSESETDAPKTQAAPGEATDQVDYEFAEIQIPVGYGAGTPWIEIYFTDPENPLSSLETGGIDSPLVESIDSARLTVDVAIYSLSLRSIRDALIRAQHRGVQVRLVMESDNLDRSAPQALLEAGVPILGDRREGLMHDKFVVIDRSEVWFGSANFTYSGLYADNNVLTRIRSVKMAENFTKEFEEMYIDDNFGPSIVADTPNQVFSIDGTEVEVYFSPDDGVAGRILSLLDDTEESIQFLAYSFTSDQLGNVIRDQSENGIIVEGVMDADQVKSNIGTEYDAFKQAGLNVFIDDNKDSMHHKMMILDKEIVITGSYNFSNSAEKRNDENVVIIHNEKIADFFIKEFQRIYLKAE